MSRSRLQDEQPAHSRHRLVLPGLLLLLATVLLPQVLQAQSLRVLYEGGNRHHTLRLVQLEPNSQEYYVSANELSQALDLERFWKPETQKMVFKVEDRRVQVTVGTRLVINGSRDVLLHVPVHYQRGSVMLPLEFVEQVLAPAASDLWSYDAAQLTFHVGLGKQDVVSIEYRSVQGDTEIRINLERGFRYRADAGSSRIVRLRIFGAHLDPVTMAQDAPAPLIRTVRAEQHEDDATLFFELDRDVDGHEASEENGGKTIVLLIRRPLDPMPRPEFKLPEASGPAPALGEETESCQVLVLDAGHGGYDTGVRVPGMSEKNMTLELAKKMKPLLEKRLGMRVELLRGGDRALTNDRRAELANKSQGDILISLHCNGWFDDTANGFEVLFVGPQNMLQSTNQMSATTADADMGFRRWDSAHLPYAGRSQVLAQILQIEMGRSLPIRNRGAKEANIDFLKGLAMPAVMLEVGFLTNTQEAAVLSDPSYPAALAASIAAAIERFCEQFEDGKAPSTGVQRSPQAGLFRTGAGR